METFSEAFYKKREFSRESRVLTLSFTWRFRGNGEQSDRQRDNGIDGDIDGLY